MTVGENIKRIRKEKGLTQKKLGELCNPPISESNIRKYENGKQNPKIETMDRIAYALNIDIVDLMDDLPFKSCTKELGYLGVEKITDDGVTLDSGESKWRILGAFDKLNKTGKWEAIKRIEELTEIKKYTD